MMNLIGAGKICSLQDLILSDATNDKTQIAIYNAEGKFVTRGKWYSDQVLAYAERFGKAYKAGTGLTITFLLI